MRIEFEATLDDIVDAHLRLQSRSRVVRAWRRRAVALSVLLGGLLMFLLTPPPFPSRLLWAGIGAVFCAALWLLFPHRKLLRRRLRRYLREQLGTDGPVKVQVELTQSGIRTKQGDTQFTFEWTSVTAIEEKPDSIELVARGGLVLVRNEWFESPDVRRQFVECARNYLDLARGPDSPGSEC